MKLEIVSSQRPLLETEVSEVIVPGDVGEFGVLPGHKPFLAQLGTGVLTYNGGAVMVSGGVCEVLEDRVVILSEYAQLASEIDLGEAKQRLAQLEKELDALPPGDERTGDLSGRVQRWKARISTVSK